MPTSWIVEPDDVFEDCHFSIAARLPGPLPKQLGLKLICEISALRQVRTPFKGLGYTLADCPVSWDHFKHRDVHPRGLASEFALRTSNP